MTRTCDHCGGEFETLTKKRLHDCPNPPSGPHDWTEQTTKGMDLDEIAARAADGLYRCVSCEQKAPEAELTDREVSESGVYLAVEFTCPHCGTFNENEAEVS